MRNQRLRLGGSRRLTLLLLAVAVPPAATLLWLGVQLLQQDRALLAQREFEHRQALTQSAVHSLEMSLAEIERHHLDGSLPTGAVRFLVSAEGMEARPADRVLWLAAPRTGQHAEARQFAQAEALEFQGRAEQAVSTYERAASSPSAAVQAGALLRIGRVRRSQRRWDAALKVYHQLAMLTDVAIEGTPADLQARRASCGVLEESGRDNKLKDEAATLESDLLAARWMLDRPAWELTARDLERWTGHPVIAEAAQRMFSAVSEAIWNRREQADHSHQTVVVDHVPVTLLWQLRGATAVVLALSPTVVNIWLQDAGGAESTERARVSVVAPSGEIVAGPAPSSAHSTVRASASDTGLPWTVVLNPSESPATTAEFVNRRRLLSIALAAMLMLLAGASYFLWRVMQRELEVGRLQTDFVSAVSHEFRTPLTSLRHVTELLEENDELPRERRRAFYAALDRNTERLHRLVESLLDFARMEGGRKPYEFRTVDAGALAAKVVAEFQNEVAERGYRLDLHVAPEAAVPLHVDASSLTNALWNLLDNAVKYSPDHRVIHVSLHSHAAGVAIAVRDHGLGIPAHERKEIFERFVRGAQARQLGIHGTGLGLAMVSHIVRAHGGTVELESAEGSGSTFTIVLPVEV